MNFIETFKKYSIYLMSRLECLLAKMAYTKSHIQWEAKLSKKPDRHHDGLWHYTGKVKGCDFYINIYGCSGYWMWSIRSKQNHINSIVGHSSYKLLSNAKKEAAKWAVVQFIRQIDPNFLKGDHYGYNTICRFYDKIPTLLHRK